MSVKGIYLKGDSGIIQTVEQLESFYDRAKNEPLVIWDVETTGLDVYGKDWIIGHAFHLPSIGWSVYVPVRHRHDSAINLPIDGVNQIIQQLFENENLILLTHNGKFDIKFARKEGIIFEGKLADTMLMAHLWSENERELFPQIKRPYGLKELGVRYLNHDADAERRALEPHLIEWREMRVRPVQEQIEAIESQMTELRNAYKESVRSDKAQKIKDWKRTLTKAYEKEYGAVTEAYRQQIESRIAHVKGEITDIDKTLNNQAFLCKAIEGYAPLVEKRAELMKQIVAINKVQAVSILAELPIEPVAEYAMQDVKLTYGLYNFFKPSLEKQNLFELFLGAKEDLCDYVGAIHRMEWNGVLVDKEFVMAQIERCNTEQKRLEEEAFALAGKAFNLASPKQIGEIIGQKETNKEALEECEHPVAQAILQSRKWGKARGTYFEPFLEKLDTKGRMHPDFFLHGTVAGRASGSVFMTFPRESDFFNVRGSLIAPPDYVMADFDYSQAELRLYAFYSKEPILIKAYQDGIDIHTQTAQLLGLESMGFTPKLARQIGKRINFTTIYGAGPDGLIHALKMEGVKCEEWGIDYFKAKEFLDRYRNRFPRANRWVRDTTNFAERNKYVRLWTGRIRRYPSFKANYGGTYTKAHTAVNNVIQGGVAEIVRIAITRLDRMIQGTGIELWLQVHDSIVMAIPESLVEEWVPKVLRKMETVAKFGSVPIVADCKIGKRWNEMKPYERGN